MSTHIGIVKEKHVSDALAYKAQHPHPWAVARFEYTKAENEYKRIWAEVYGEQTKGTDLAKKASTDRDERVCAARSAIAKAQFEMDSHKARLDAADSLLNIFQTESANTRSCEKMR